MIGSMFGIVDEIHKDHILINVNYIGYIVYLSEKSLSYCKLNENIKLYIHSHITKDSSTFLYGFANKEEKDCMHMLIKVNGISCKTAIAILSHLTPKEVILAIYNSDKMAFKINGLGPKLISRIINEMYEEATKIKIDTSHVTIDQDSLSALINLGYDKKRSYEIIKKIKNEFPDINTKEIIFKALRLLA